MKDQSNERGARPVQTDPPAPQLTLRTGLRAGADADCELGIGYWRREFNRWRQIAQEMGCA